MAKKLKVVFIALPMLAMILMAVSCKFNKDLPEQEYTITYVLNGGTVIPPPQYKIQAI